MQIYVLLFGGWACAWTLDQWCEHDFPIVTALTLFGSWISYIYSAPPLKLKQEGWRGNYALGASYIALPWWAGQAVFGELSLFDPGPRTATATAITDTVVVGLGHGDLRPWLTGRPEVAEALLQALAQRLSRTNEALADLVFSDVPGRVAKQLLDLADKFGQPGPDGVLVHHDLTQEELAQLVGASRETVNKALADFTQRGWVEVDQRQVLLIDMERLARRAR